MKHATQHHPPAIIVSDLHLGSKYFLARGFERFLENIPEDHDVILNGDILDKPAKKLTRSHRGILDRIAHLSCRQRVVWVWGNHDKGQGPNGFGKVEFKRLHNLGQRLLIAHGDNFDEVMPKSRIFMMAFKLLHDLRIKLGGKPEHVANYAKKWGFLYGVLRKNVMVNAVNCALQKGYEAVVCGHTHYPEDRFFNGVRYINTGAWTESRAFYLLVTEEEMSLVPFKDSLEFEPAKSPVTKKLPSHPDESHVSALLLTGQTR